MNDHQPQKLSSFLAVITPAEFLLRLSLHILIDQTHWIHKPISNHPYPTAKDDYSPQPLQPYLCLVFLERECFGSVPARTTKHFHPHQPPQRNFYQQQACSFFVTKP